MANNQMIFMMTDFSVHPKREICQSQIETITNFNQSVSETKPDYTHLLLNIIVVPHNWTVTLETN